MLRHTCATLLLAGGLDSIYVQRILDDRDPETTARLHGPAGAPGYNRVVEIDK